MASLTKVSIISRKVVRYGIYLVILTVVARYSIRAGTALYEIYRPNPCPSPTVGFGKVTTLPFPDREDQGYPSPADLSYILETPEGGLPKLNAESEKEDGLCHIPVYFMPRQTSSLGVLEEARQTARILGFRSEGRRLIENVPNIYEFRMANQPQTLLINIITGTFSISYDLDSNRDILEGVPPAGESATETVKSYLSSIIAEDINNGRAETEYKRIEGGTPVDASSLSEAQLTKVNLYRKGFTEMEIPSVTADAIEANVWFNVASGGNVVNGEYHYYPLNEEQSETYPIISAQEAYDKLRSGQAYLANIDDPNVQNITIRRVYLGYYDAGQYAEFYQPVIVFEGDNGFFAYVPAVTDEYYGE